MSVDITIKTLRPVRRLADMLQFVPDVQANFENLKQRVGTWTPTIVGSGQTYTLQLGRYIRDGKRVWIRFDIQLSVLGLVTGTVSIKGLPAFPIEQVGFMLEYWQNMTTAVLGIPARIAAGATVITLDKLTAATASSTAAQLVQADLSATVRLAGTCIFYIA